MDRAADVILALRLKGVRIWSEDGRLRYKASNGMITPADLNKLTELKTEILAFIQQASPASTESKLIQRGFTERVPLTFSQKAWWNLLGLGKHPSKKSVFTAVRLQGSLNVPSLRGSFAELVRRHQVLRTTIITVEGTHEQCIHDEHNHALLVVDLTDVAEGEREVLAERLTLELVVEPVDVAVGPLFGGRLIKLRDDDHIMVIAMDHLISDAASMGILLRDLWTLYGQAQQGLPFTLPRLPVQFADYAVWQQKSHPSWIDKHGTYWADRLSGARHVRLFADDEVTKGTGTIFASVPIRFGKALSAGLRDLSRRERTTLATAVLCAYGASALRWCGAMDIVVPFVTMGRTRPELEHVIGFFGCPLFLRLELRENDSFLDLLGRVREEHTSAYEHHDLGEIWAQMPRPEFTCNLSVNWYPADYRVHHSALTAFVDNSDVPGLGKQLRLQPFSVKNPLQTDFGIDLEWGGEGGLILTDSEDGITGTIVYRNDRLAADSVSRFGRNLLLFAERLLRESHRRVRTCQLCE